MSWPILNVRRPTSGKLDGSMMSFGRQRYHQIERVVLKVIEHLAAMPREVDAEFFHDHGDEWVDFHIIFIRINCGTAQSTAIDKDANAPEPLQKGLGHRRSDLIVVATEENSIRQP